MTGESLQRVVVVGSGVAGLQTALVLRRLAPRCAVVLTTKTSLAESNTRWAQGGIAAVVPDAAAGVEAATDGPRDSVDAHIADTLAAGAGLSDPEAAAVLCGEAAQGIAALQAAGVVFDTSPADPGVPARGREAAHSAARVLHLGGDATGAGLVAALTAAVRRDPGIEVLEDTLVTRVLLDGDGPALGGDGPALGVRRRATGVEVLSGGVARDLPADAVVLATGGAGQLFESTTNPRIATGDGVALAWRAGAAVADLEFFQFHPTSLDVPGNPLISEAVRGEGARLIDADGHPFMAGYHPDGDLAPRDVVSRSIAQHLAGGRTGRAAGDGDRGGPGAQDGRRRPAVYLDATGLGRDFLARRFPTLTALTARHGLDWSSTPVPVVPAAHYWMGGVRTDTAGRTSVPGLLAVGEVARTGVHGANRLASNSLLEGVVFGARCAEALAAGGGEAPSFDVDHLDLEAEETGTQSFTRADLQSVLSDHAGVLRTGAGLELARKHLASYRPDTDADPELANLLLCARLLVHAASRRTASVGAHQRLDQPDSPPQAPAPSRSYARTPEGTRP
ncbi:L-aspartate oxidase [Arthrobacter pityocampae]|uniref:L-aspartate oxidase n=1 Tax=Arthrobacter pityocampae TaxID=547334 RepID=A0A2S5J1H0_9MICC|nr:L-aspartate oxidase [Arthrobacter pityocampae]PPB50645.1 L-aspartate oxidase [Arthrobacter pityocampae]